MSVTYKRTELGKGIALTEIYDRKFKSTRIKLSFIFPADPDIIYPVSLLSALLVTSNDEYRNKTDLVRFLARNYGARIGAGNGRFGDNCTLELLCSFIGDKYTIGGESISVEVTRQLLNCILRPDISTGRFNEDYFKLRRSELADNIRASINDKRSYALWKAEGLIFRGEPIVYTTAGDTDRALSLTQEETLEALHRIVRDSAIEVSVCGDGTCDEAVDLIRESLLSLDRPEVGRPVYRTPSPVKPQPLSEAEEMDLRQSKLFMAYKSPYEDIYVCKVFSALLGSTPFSKLFTNVREKLSLCYYCSAVYSETKGTMIIDSGVDNANIDRIQTAIDEQLRLIRDGGFTDEELLNTKRFLCGLYKSNADSTGAMISWYEAQNSRGTSYSLEEQSERVMSVTREQVMECAASFRLDSTFVLKAKEGENS